MSPVSPQFRKEQKLCSVRRGSVRSVQCCSSSVYFAVDIAVTRVGSHSVEVCRVDGDEAAVTHLSLPRLCASLLYSTPCSLLYTKEKGAIEQQQFTVSKDRERPPLWSSGQSSWLHNGDVVWFLWGTIWIYICYVEERRPPLWSRVQSSWLQIQRSGFDSWRYQIFWEVVVGFKRGPFSLVSTIEELLERRSSGSGLETREYGRRDLSRWPRYTLYPQKVGTNFADKGGRSFGIVLSRAHAAKRERERESNRVGSVERWLVSSGRAEALFRGLTCLALPG
jgi:hypothetical protein